MSPNEPQFALAGEDEEALEDADMHDAERDGEDPPIPSARFWEALLRERHHQLLQQDEAAVQEWREQNMQETEVSPLVHAAGSFAVLTHCFS